MGRSALRWEPRPGFSFFLIYLTCDLGGFELFSPDTFPSSEVVALTSLGFRP